MAALEESFGSELFRYEEHCLRRQPCGFCFRKGCGGEWEKDKEDVQRRGSEQAGERRHRPVTAAAARWRRGDGKFACYMWNASHF